MTSAARSIRCWSRASSSAASRRGSAARCRRSSSTTRAARRSRPRSPTIYMLTAHEVPPVDVLLTEDAPSPLNPLGLKGAGEGGVNAVGAAIASAIDDAISPAGRDHATAGDAGAAEGAAEIKTARDWNGLRTARRTAAPEGQPAQIRRQGADPARTRGRQRHQAPEGAAEDACGPRSTSSGCGNTTCRRNSAGSASA